MEIDWPDPKLKPINLYSAPRFLGRVLDVNTMTYRDASGSVLPVEMEQEVIEATKEWPSFYSLVELWKWKRRLGENVD